MSADASLVRHHLAHPGANLWLPTLTSALVETRKNLPVSDVFPSCEAYTTSGYLLGSGNRAERTFVIQAATRSAAPSLRIECFSTAAAAHFTKKGLLFLAADAHSWPATVQAISTACALIGVEPTLARTVERLVHSLHVLRVDDPAYDVSYSDPTLPFSIFVTVAGAGPVAAARTAEAIIHEAMHLQLTLIEQLVPLAEEAAPRQYSPWKRETRPVSGLIHAMYVFSVIDRWLERVQSNATLAAYSKHRRAQIAAEFKAIDLEACARGATADGRVFLQSIIKPFRHL